MRQILVDYARRHRADKRGGGAVRLELDAAAGVASPMDVDIVRLDEALNTLKEMDPQQSRVVEMKFFAGLTIEETAEVLGISESGVKREWFTARAWLLRELERSPSS
jgi:RNA polymerase sigma factor (TIGR02999 family)